MSVIKLIVSTSFHKENVLTHFLVAAMNKITEFKIAYQPY